MLPGIFLLYPEPTPYLADANLSSFFSGRWATFRNYRHMISKPTPN